MIILAKINDSDNTIDSFIIVNNINDAAANIELGFFFVQSAFFGNVAEFAYINSEVVRL
jgi:hypothetical protein